MADSPRLDLKTEIGAKRWVKESGSRVRLEVMVGALRSTSNIENETSRASDYIGETRCLLLRIEQKVTGVSELSVRVMK